LFVGRLCGQRRTAAVPPHSSLTSLPAAAPRFLLSRGDRLDPPDVNATAVASLASDVTGAADDAADSASESQRGARGDATSSQSSMVWVC